MFARQLQQLQQETATVTNLAQQLQYAIKNTTGAAQVLAVEPEPAYETSAI